MNRITKQVDTSLWSEFQSIFPGNASAEEYMVRRMVSPRSGAANDNDQLILGFVSTMMFLVLPAVWMGALGWTGYNVGSSIGSSINNSSSPVQKGGQSGAQKGQSAATKGKL